MPGWHLKYHTFKDDRKAVTYNQDTFSFQMRWPRANGCPRNHYTCSKAAQGGHLETLQWARANGCPRNEDTCNFAAQDGHLDVSQLPVGKSKLMLMGSSGVFLRSSGWALEILQLARANGCPWDSGTCTGASLNGHLQTLQWARAHACPWVVGCAPGQVGMDILRPTSGQERMNAHNKL